MGLLSFLGVLSPAHITLFTLTARGKLGGFVNCTSDFTDMPVVINGASNLIADVMGDAGKHARFAVGAPSLPLGVAVEIDAVFALV